MIFRKASACRTGLSVLSKRPAHISRIMEIRFADPELTPLQRREQHQFQEYFNTIWKELDVHV